MKSGCGSTCLEKENVDLRAASVFQQKSDPIKIIEIYVFQLKKVTQRFFKKHVLVPINDNRNKMLNRISEIGIHISIQNLLRNERVNDISRYDVAESTLGN